MIFFGEKAPIVIMHKFVRPPYGGGNQFLLALKNEWEALGYKIGVGKINKHTKAVLFNSFNFDFKKIKNVDSKKIFRVHRVDGPVGAYRGEEAQEDRDVWSINHECADATIFQSLYSLKKHEEMGLKFKNPVIIHNAANPRIFYPKTKGSLPKDRKVRIIASSWSDNKRKGADVYQWLDQNLDRNKYEFTFVGRIGVELKNSKVLPAMGSEELAQLLRTQDIYITASQNDSCSNSLIEALTSGLPALYLNSGGHPELVGDGGLPFVDAEELPNKLEQLVSQYERIQNLISVSKLSDVARKYLDVLLPAQGGMP